MRESRIQQSPPIVQAMVLADAVRRDSTTGKHTILGTFNMITASRFPCHYEGFAIYVSITDGHGETPVKTRLVDMDEAREPIFEFDEILRLPEPTSVHEAVFTYKRVIFPEPGDYCLQFYAAGELLRELRLTVVGKAVSQVSR